MNIKTIAISTLSALLAVGSGSGAALALAWGDYWIYTNARSIGQCIHLLEHALEEAGAVNIKRGAGPSMYGEISGQGVAGICMDDGSVILAADGLHACNTLAQVLEENPRARHC
ncbi:MAG: hypothetical protein AAF728_05310 [Cyanobacteria bacterium P01_D01_bin.128]